MSAFLRLILLLFLIASCSIVAIGQCKVSAGNDVSTCQNAIGVITAIPSGGTAISYFWNSIPAAIVKAGNQFTIPTATTGTFTYEVTANFGTCIAKDTVKVTVNPLPVANFTFPATSTCSGAAVVFTSGVTNGTAPFTYTWDFGDGQTSAAANPSHAFTSRGCSTATFTVTLIVTDAKGCTSAIVSKSITIIQAPDVQISDRNIFSPFSNCINSPTPANPNYTLTIDNVSPSVSCITSYSINWGDGVTQNGVAFPLTHTYIKLGAFNLTVTALGANGCSSSKTYVVANQTNPAGSLGTLGSTTNLCAPTIVPFTIGNWQINSPGTIYVLDFGDG
ncbi:MAG: PKD domain-containing protein, partial [Ferruginibacter sp.]